MKGFKVIHLQDTDIKGIYMDIDGNVYSTRQTRIYKLKKQKNVVSGYEYINETPTKKRYVHRLQGNAYLGLDLNNPKMQINHINKIKDDNKLSNLEIVTPKQNMRHAHGHENYKEVI